MNIEQIEKRLAEIKAEIVVENADVDALAKESDELLEQRSILLKEIETRKTTLDKLAKGQIGQVKEDLRKEERNMEFTKENVFETKEYRSAWLKNLRGMEMNEVETRAFTVANSKAIPVELQNEIIAKTKEIAPILNKVTLLHVKGGVKFAVEGAIADAQLHAENAEITADADTMVEVILSAYEITKLIQISASVENMAIDAFAEWIVDAIAEKVANKASQYLIKGTGNSQPTGIDTIAWDENNSVTVANGTDTTAKNVQALIGLLPACYDKKACFVMSKRTLFTDFMPLQDNSKNKLVTNEGNRYFVYGYEVVLDDNVTLHEAYLGDFKKLVANMSADVDVTSQFELRTNSYLYLGACQFDSKVALANAFVKLVKATA